MRSLPSRSGPAFGPWLTFDDGPGPHTAALLDVLALHHVSAVFFVLGQQVQRHPDLVRRAAAEGHAVGNHSWDHPVLTELPEAAIAEQLTRTSELLLAVLGVRPSLFRPPYGLRDARVDRAVARLGMRTVLWSVGTADFLRPGAGAIAVEIERGGPQDIVLLHDGGGDRTQTVAAVDLALARARSGWTPGPRGR